MVLVCLFVNVCVCMCVCLVCVVVCVVGVCEGGGTVWTSLDDAVYTVRHHRLVTVLVHPAAC